ncbi:hypothetical protein CsSME_00026152 [Camellia sinensis var. sinensis]
MDVNGENMGRRWQKETRAPEPTIVAPWQSVAQFANKCVHLLHAYFYCDLSFKLNVFGENKLNLFDEFLSVKNLNTFLKICSNFESHIFYLILIVKSLIIMLLLKFIVIYTLLPPPLLPPSLPLSLSLHHHHHHHLNYNHNCPTKSTPTQLPLLRAIATIAPLPSQYKHYRHCSHNYQPITGT